MPNARMQPGRGDEGSFAAAPGRSVRSGREATDAVATHHATLVGAWIGLALAPLLGMIVGYVVRAVTAPEALGEGILVGALIGAIIGPVVGFLSGRALDAEAPPTPGGGVLREA